MATKRAIQLLSLRTSSTIPRSQCAAPQRTTPRAISRITTNSRPQVELRQRRWQSVASISGERISKVYEFEDIQKLATPSKSASSSHSEPLLIDVREPHEYTPSHIPTAINIPISSQPDALLLSAEDFEDRFGFEKPGIEREVVFYCKAGVRSRFAAEVAKRAGFEKVGEYRGSWVDWIGKGGEGEGQS